MFSFLILLFLFWMQEAFELKQGHPPPPAFGHILWDLQRASHMSHCTCVHLGTLLQSVLICPGNKYSHIPFNAGTTICRSLKMSSESVIHVKIYTQLHAVVSGAGIVSLFTALHVNST